MEYHHDEIVKPHIPESVGESLQSYPVEMINREEKIVRDNFDYPENRERRYNLRNKPDWNLKYPVMCSFQIFHSQATNLAISYDPLTAVCLCSDVETGSNICRVTAGVGHSVPGHCGSDRQREALVFRLG